MKYITLSPKAALKFRKRLATLQKNLGIETTTELAKYLDCRRNTVADWLNGKSLPSLEAVEKVNSWLNERLEHSKTETESIQIYLTGR